MIISKLIKDNYEKRPNKKYIYEKINGEYQGITFKDFIEKTNYLGYYLLDKNLKDKNILLIGKNSINYMITDLAILSYVGVVVNINKDTKEKEIKEIINNTNIECIIYDEDKKEEIDKIKEEYENIFYLSMNEYEDIFNSYKNRELFNFEEKDNDKCSKIVFSSGTTSNPKAVMLSLKNIFAGWESLQRRTKFYESDVIYLFLPLHHTYAGIYNFLYSLISGLSIYLSSGIENIGKELQEVNPTIFCSVPLLYRKIYEVAQDKLKYAFGKNIRFLYSGGSPFPKEIREVYLQNNLPLLEAYALTETASSFSIDYPNDKDKDSVGTIFEDIDVIVKNPDENGIGEIAVKGDNVFIGYYNNDQATKNAFDENNYFLTGDLGYIKNNKLYLVGRKKKILIGENGENIYPEDIEKKLKEKNNNITHVKAYLKNNKLVCAIYVKEYENLDELIKTYNLECTKKDIIKDYEIILDTPENRLKG